MSDGGCRPPPTRARRSEILDEGFQICAPDCGAEKDMQACRINDVTDFLAESIRNPIKADFQSLDDPFSSTRF